MFGIPVLEVATGLVFVYLLFSLLVSALNEALMGHLVHFRCRVLEDSLRSLLSNQGNTAPPCVQLFQTLEKIVAALGAFFVRRDRPSAEPKNFAEHLFQHPLVAGLATHGHRCPNYLPAGTFADAVIGILNDAARPPPCQ